VQGPHQDGEDAHKRPPVCHVRRRPEGGGDGHRAGAVTGEHWVGLCTYGARSRIPIGKSEAMI
jgi:hypothetical protein